MIRTISIGSCIQVQGLFEKLDTDGRMTVRVGTQTYEGKPVAHQV